MKTNKLDTELRAILGDEDYKYTDKPHKITALLKVEVAKAKIKVLTKFKSDYADDLSVEAYEELVEIISKLQAEVESNDN